jgi:hypothetical protein
MNVTWGELRARHRWVIAKLANADPDEELLGVELEEFPREMRGPLGMLLDLGLAELELGWRGSVWVRLTEAGRQVRSERQIE